jgi:hypothetical protein
MAMKRRLIPNMRKESRVFLHGTWQGQSIDTKCGVALPHNQHEIDRSDWSAVQRKECTCVCVCILLQLNVSLLEE